MRESTVPIKTIFFVLPLLLRASLCTQAQAPEVKHDQPLPTIEEQLKRHNVESSRPALLKALHSREVNVRSLAARKLAQLKATEATPAIAQALSSEKVPEARLNLAFSLAQLGGREGVVALGGICRDGSLESWVRVQSGQYLFDLLKVENRSCRASLLQGLRSNPSGESFVGTVSLLQRVGGLSPNERRIVVHAAGEALTSSDPALRIAASQTLGDLGDASALPRLQKAFSIERDSTVLARMNDDLKRLGR